MNKSMEAPLTTLDRARMKQWLAECSSLPELIRENEELRRLLREGLNMVGSRPANTIPEGETLKTAEWIVAARLALGDRLVGYPSTDRNDPAAATARESRTE